MNWRGSTDVKDKIFSALVYLFPLYYLVQSFGIFLWKQFPELIAIISIPLAPINQIYGAVPFADLIIFFILFLAVVRNPRISHFIRYNTMQAILLDILLFLLSIVLGAVLGPIFGDSLITETLFNTVFIGGLAVCGYSIVQSLLGKYAEIPQLSEAVYSQVR